MMARMKVKIRVWADAHRPQLLGLIIGALFGCISSGLAIWSMRGVWR
jgi:hypothetical protein